MIELLLYLALSAAILLAVSVFLSILLRSRIKNQTVAEVEQQGIAVMNHLTAAIRSAENINEPALGLSAGSLSLDAFGSTNDPAGDNSHRRERLESKPNFFQGHRFRGQLSKFIAVRNAGYCSGSIYPDLSESDREKRI